MYIKYDDISDLIKFVLDTALKEARKEERLTNQLLITMLSAYSNNPLNLLINAPSGVGKNYVINTVASLFPQSDILSLAGMTDKALFHRPGTLVIKNENNGEYEPIDTKLNDIENEINDLENELAQTRDKNQKQELKISIQELNEEKKNLLKDAKKLIDLSNKVIIFLDTPPEHLLAGLLPLLSHDKYEIEYEYVDTHNGIKTKNNVLRGWPAVVCAQALDYSHSARFPEYQRRFITTNPTMSKEKFDEAINLIHDRFSFPDLIYQHKIVSDEEKDKAPEIIKGFKEQVQDICRNVKPGKNNVIIPYSSVILESLPKEKASDMTRANRLFAFLSFLPIVQFDKRPRLAIIKKGDISIQTIPIATFEDLQNTISLMEYSDGVRPYILEWYYNVFLKAFEEKHEPDLKINSKGDELKEDKLALTSQDIIKKHFEIHNETLTTKRLLESYLYPLLNQGYIDKIDSIIDRRAKIYYPVITTKKYINLFENAKSNNLSQQKQKMIVKSRIFPSKEHIISKIQPILNYYSESGFIVNIKNHKDENIILEDLVNQYFGNTGDFFEVEDGGEANNHNSNDSNSNSGNDDDANVDTDDDETKTNPDSTDTILVKSNKDISETEKEKNNFSNNGFSEEYIQNSRTQEQLQGILNKDVNNITFPDKVSNKLFETTKTNKIIYSDIEANYLTNKSSVCCCHYCKFTSNSENELLIHSVNSHPGLPARPDPNLLKLVQNKNEKKEEEI